MIVFFLLYNYGLSLLEYFGINKIFAKKYWSVLIFDVPTVDGITLYSEEQLKFVPPLYIQRYELVKKILSNKAKESALKVIDFGCSEIKFFSIIKHMKGIQEYIAVDIDSERLFSCSSRVLPLTFDYLRKRTEPLKVQVLCGCVSQPDYRLENSNAVIAIELIEHLYPEALDNLPYNIFGIIQPEIAVFTTPNSDYNIYFPNFSGFRHNDHKFEWSREQFQSWARNLELRFPNYKVVFGGVGQEPNGSHNFGYCTQVAVFFRNRIKLNTSSKFSDVYKEVRKIEYPYTTEAEQLANIINEETDKFITSYSKLDCYQCNGQIEIPLKDILCFLSKAECSCTEQTLREALISWGQQILTRGDGTSILIPPIYGEEDLDDSYSSPVEDYELPDFSQLPPADEENWDAVCSVVAMDFTENGVGKANNKGNETPVEDNEVRESHHFAQSSERSFLEPLYQNAEGNNSTRLPFPAEEPQSSAKIDEKIDSSLLSHFEHSSTSLKHENSAEKRACFARSPLQKCHSMENINRDGSRNNVFRFSLNIDKYKFIDCDNGASEAYGVHKVSSVVSVSENCVPRLEDSCSQSKAADSGYPNSYGQDMDMDLTPEQVDEIITESESSFDGDAEDESGGEEDEPIGIRGEIVRLGENVENGDVANNNRDGEGNNMEAVAAEGILQFEQVIAEEEAVGNLAAANVPDSDEDLGLHSVGDSVVVADGLEVESEDVILSPSEANSVAIPNDYVTFPHWLLNILADDLGREEGDGGGDVGSTGPSDALENESSFSQEVSQFNGSEPNDEVELAVELIIEGDLMGAGDPPPTIE